MPMTLKEKAQLADAMAIGGHMYQVDKFDDTEDGGYIHYSDQYGEYTCALSLLAVCEPTFFIMITDAAIATA